MSNEHHEPERKHSPTMERFLAGALAAGTAEVFTLPIDCTKIRLQAQSTSPNLQQYNGMLDAGKTIIKEEGPFALWKGSAPALTRQVTYTSIAMLLYEPFRDMIGAKSAEGEEVPFVKKLMAGGFAGGFGCIVANPVDVMKVRMQNDRAGKLYDSMFHAATTISKHEGIRGFMQGIWPSIQRGFAVNAAELATYDQTKEMLVDHNIVPEGVLAHTGASLVAGLAGACASNPLDVVKTRLMSQPTDERGRGKLYKGMLHCAKTTLKDDGLMGFYNGFIPNWMRKAPWCLIFFVTYEQYRPLVNPVKTYEG